MPTLLVLAASVWTLTNACSDDALQWESPVKPEFATVCATWKGQTLCRPEPPLPIGCYDGEILVETVDAFGNVMSRVSVPWEKTPGRLMEWFDMDQKCPVSSPGRCMEFDSTGRCLSWDRPCPTGMGPPVSWP